MLVDSTQVWLNAASSLEFPDQFDVKKREVFLSGEAFFDVKNAGHIPFVIHAGDISVTVLGTAFNVKAYPAGQVTVAVSRGKVKVTRSDGWQTILGKGEQVKLAPETKTVTAKPIAVSEVAAWQQGYLVFDDEPLSDIIADLERIYNVTIKRMVIPAQPVKISTSFRKDIGIEQALQVLCRLTDSQFSMTDNIYVIK
jgi:ferric-dicitrate binding protein FerR (iron transport regulator)